MNCRHNSNQLYELPVFNFGSTITCKMMNNDPLSLSTAVDIMNPRSSRFINTLSNLLSIANFLKCVQGKIEERKA